MSIKYGVKMFSFWEKNYNYLKGYNKNHKNKMLVFQLWDRTPIIIILWPIFNDKKRRLKKSCKFTILTKVKGHFSHFCTWSIPKCQASLTPFSCIQNPRFFWLEIFKNLYFQIELHYEKINQMRTTKILRTNLNHSMSSILG